MFLGFSHQTISRVYGEWSRKEKILREQQLCGVKCPVDVRGQTGWRQRKKHVSHVSFHFLSICLVPLCDVALLISPLHHVQTVWQPLGCVNTIKLLDPVCREARPLCRRCVRALSIHVARLLPTAANRTMWEQINAVTRTRCTFVYLFICIFI